MKNPALIDLTLIDFGIIALVLISIIIGLFRGFVKEALSITVWVLSVFISMKFYGEISGYFTGVTDNSTVRSGIAISLIFITCLVTGSIISHLVSLLVKSTGLGGTDKLLGVIFGFLRGGLIAAAIMLVISYTEFSKNPIWADSFLTKQMQPIVNFLDSFIPEKVKNKVSEKSNQDKAQEKQSEKQGKE